MAMSLGKVFEPFVEQRPICVMARGVLENLFNADKIDALFARTAEVQLSLSRLNHWLPRIQAHPEVVQGTTEFHHQIADALLPQADPVFHNAAALDTAVDVLNP